MTNPGDDLGLHRPPVGERVGRRIPGGCRCAFLAGGTDHICTGCGVRYRYTRETGPHRCPPRTEMCQP
jgi:hypothetical protein